MFIVGIGQKFRGQLRRNRRRIRLPLHGGDKLAQSQGDPLRAAGIIGDRQRSQHRFGGFDLSDAQQQAGMINPFGVGAGLFRGWIPGQCRQQIARAISLKGFVERLLLFGGERQIRRINHRRIIKAPLQNVVGDETRRANGRLARLGHSLLAVGQQERGLFIAKPNLAVNHRQRLLLRVVAGLDVQNEFRAFHAGDGAAGDDPDAARFVPMEKRDDAPEQMQPALRIRRIRRQYFEFRRSAERHHASVRPKEGNPAVCARAQPVEGVENLVGLSRQPGRCGGASKLRRALQLHDLDFVRDLVTGR